jgi:(p)ppGpp synthase/HD superfamily hydrolase
MNFAAEAHEHQIRKMSGSHYIVHPYGVLEIVRTVSDDVEVQMAAILHDTVEDTDTTLEDIAGEFSPRTAFLVRGVTKDDAVEGWRDRNQAYLDFLGEKAEDGSVLIALADKIHNISDMIESFGLYGDAMWDKFSAKGDDQIWWYSSVLAIGQKRVPECPLNYQLEKLIEIFRARVVGSQARLAASFVAE